MKQEKKLMRIVELIDEIPKERLKQDAEIRAVYEKLKKVFEEGNPPRNEALLTNGGVS